MDPINPNALTDKEVKKLRESIWTPIFWYILPGAFNLIVGIIFGTLMLVFTLKNRKYWAAKDYERATKLKKYIRITSVIGLALVVIQLVFVVVNVTAGAQ